MLRLTFLSPGSPVGAVAQPVAPWPFSMARQASCFLAGLWLAAVISITHNQIKNQLKKGDIVAAKFIKLEPGLSQIGAPTEAKSTHFTGVKLGYTFGEDQIKLGKTGTTGKLDILDRDDKSVSTPRIQFFNSLVKNQYS